MDITREIYGSKFKLEFDLKPKVIKWEMLSHNNNKTLTTYKGSGYILVLKEDKCKEHTLIDFILKRESGESFKVFKYGLVTSSSCAGVNRIYIPWQWSKLWENIGLVREGFMQTSASRGIPIIMALDNRWKNKLAISFLDQRIETKLRYSVCTSMPAGNLKRGEMSFKIHRPIEGYTLDNITELHDGFFISRGLLWFDTMQLLQKVHAEWADIKHRPSPDSAWDPQWVTFGAATKGKWETMRQEEFGEEELLEMAKTAYEFGIRTITNWTPWFDDADNYKDEGRADKLSWQWPHDLGDYNPSSRYPNFKRFIAKLKSLGMYAMPWMNPWIAGKNSKVRERIKDALTVINKEKYFPGDTDSELYDLSYFDSLRFGGYEAATSYLCPRNPITQKYGLEYMVKVMKEYGLSGFTLDMIDEASMFPCIANHEHSYSSIGIAQSEMFKNLREALFKIDPNAMIEFRASYSNINNIYNATQHRSHDSGERCDHDLNRRNCVILRSYIPKGVAVHTDPQFWHIDDRNELVAKMLSTIVISGVPQIGVDLINLKEDHKKLLKNWLSFYHQYKYDFRHGDLRPVQNDIMFSTIKVENQKKAFISYANNHTLKVELSNNPDEIYLFNCTNENYLYTELLNLDGEFSLTVNNYDLSPISNTRIKSIKKSLLINIQVPEGGSIYLKKQ